MPLVYGIWADDARLPYYGSTDKTLAERRQLHKTQYKRWKEGKIHGCAAFDLFDAVGFDACEFRIIEELPEDCSKEQRLWRERWYFDNCPCVNRNRPIRTKEEELEYNRTYGAKYSVNQDSLAKRNRKYYAENRIKILEKAKEKYARKKAEKVNQTPASDPPIV